MNLSTTSSSINYGGNTNIIATGYTTINITPNNSVISINNSGNDYIINVSPNYTTLYTISGIDIYGNSLTNSITIYVNVTVLQNTVETNYNETIQLEGYGSDKYIWYPSTYLNVNNFEIVDCTPLQNITYTLLGTDIYGVQTTTNINVIVNTFINFAPSNINIYDGNIVIIDVSYYNPNNIIDQNLLTYKWTSRLFQGLPSYCINSTNGSQIKLHPYESTYYNVNVIYNNNIISSDKININVIPKPSYIIDIDIIPNKIKEPVFSRNKKELIKLLLQYKTLSKNIIKFYYTTLQTAYRMEWTNKNGCSIKINWITIYQIVNEANEMILSFEQQWKFFQFININNNGNFKFLLNTINEIYLEKVQQILITPIGSGFP